MRLNNYSYNYKFVALKGSYHCLSTWHLRHRAAAEAGAVLTRVMVDEDNETVGI